MNFIRRDMEGAGASALRAQRTRLERKWPITYDSVEIVAILVDAAIIVACSCVAGIVYHYQVFGGPGDVVKYLGSAAVAATLFISLMQSRRMYRPNELLILRRQIRKASFCWMAVLALLTGTVFALKIGDEFSRGANLMFAIGALAALAAQRLLWVKLLTRGVLNQRFSGRKIVLIMDHRESADPNLPQALTDLGFQLVRHFTLPSPSHGTRKRKDTILEAIASVRGSEIEEVVVSADLRNWRELRGLLAEMRVLPFPISLIPTGALSEVFKQPSHELGGAVCIEVQRGPLTPFECALKRSIDVVIGGIALVASLPLFVLVAIAIKLDSRGPVLFDQQRCGFNGRCFRIIKFRTMLVQEDGEAVMQVLPRDKRVSRVGKWLRRTSVDELPQLVNVLQGSMSLVGPRPHAVAHDTQFDKMVRNYAFRHRVKPGLTGWAQVHGCRGPTPTPEDVERRVNYDLWYIDNWSFGLDFFIMLQTVFEVLRARNAY